MPTLKPGTIKPTKLEDAAITKAAMSDADAMPLTDAEWLAAKPKVSRGRPMGSGSKVQVTMRIDTEVLALLKASGTGWQTRANDALGRWIRRQS